MKIKVIVRRYLVENMEEKQIKKLSKLELQLVNEQIKNGYVEVEKSEVTNRYNYYKKLKSGNKSSRFLIINREDFKLYIDKDIENNLLFMSEAQKSTWRVRGQQLIRMIEKCHLKEYIIEDGNGDNYCKFENGRFFVNNNQIGFTGKEMKYWFNNQHTWECFQNFFANAYKTKLNEDLNS